MSDLSPDDLDRIRPILELAAARQQAVDAVFAGDSIPARVVNAASWLSGWLQDARDKGRLTSTETDVPRLIGDRLLSEANASPARLWYVERNGTLGTHELERLEIGLAGLLESIKTGERFNPADVQAVHSAATGLRIVFGMEPAPSTADAKQQAPAEPQQAGEPLAEQQAGDGRDGPKGAAGKLPAYAERAYQSYELAAAKMGGQPTDKEVYHWLKEHGPTEYKMPKLRTWKSHVRRGRRFYGTQKNTRRAGRMGRSVVRSDEL